MYKFVRLKLFGRSKMAPLMAATVLCSSVFVMFLLASSVLVHLIQTYRQKLKSAKPVLRTVKRWTNEAEQDLKACFGLTDWSVFEAVANDLDKLTETVTSYISFCEDMCIPTRTRLTC